MSYQKSLRRERVRIGNKARQAVRYVDDDPYLMDEALSRVKRLGTQRSSLDAKLKAANSRDVEALMEAEWDY